MFTARSSSLFLLTVGGLVLAVELLRASLESLAAIALFGVIWAVRERLLRKPHHHHHSFHRARRDMLTTAVLAGVIIALAALALTAFELTGESQALGQLGVAGDDQLPWTAGLLANGVLTLVALTSVLLAGRALQRRSRRHEERTV